MERGFAVLIQLFPYDKDEEGRWTLAGPWNTQEEAQDYIDNARRSNLPYKVKKVISWVAVP